MRGIRPLRALARPEYWYNPRQLWRRLWRRRLYARNQVILAWGLPIEVDADCRIGEDIVNLGVFDPLVPEAVCRLLDRGEAAVDVGANIGQNTSIMALQAGAAGRVFAFEPHPQLWSVLCRNVTLWRAFDLAPITVRQQALSAQSGEAILQEPIGFEGDGGSATLEPTVGRGRSFAVETVRLDDVVTKGDSIGLAKLDVEGHEEKVLAGSDRLLRQRDIRDVVIESLEGSEARSLSILREAGYVLFGLVSHWSGPELVPFARCATRTSLEIPNYLATLAPERALERFAVRGWRCLRMRAQRQRQPSERAGE